MPIKSICLTVFLCFFLIACQPTQKTLKYSGQTMGTTYNVVVVTDNEAQSEIIGDTITRALEKVNAQLSNWDSNSEISRFNDLKSSQPAEISEDLTRVMEMANTIHEKSGGIFDITISPLIEIWGFGSEARTMAKPSDQEVQAALNKIGQADKLVLNARQKTLLKLDPNTQINLSPIGKGYGIDQIANGLAGLGINDFLVEIGGDLVARGKNPHGNAWQIGIEQPDPLKKDIHRLVTIHDMAMATSGDYKNYFEEGGIKYSHIINPKTGFPITHKTVSVTVLAENATLADGWATALLALGERQGMKIAEQNKIAALFIFNDGDNAQQKLNVSMSSAFEDLK